MKILKRVILIILLVMSTAFSIFVFNGFIEKTTVDTDINAFKERGVFVETIDNNSYYKVKAKDSEDGKGVFDYQSGTNYIGTTGDIIITNRNPLRYSKSFITRNIVNFFSKNMFIGHATYNVSSDGSMMVEITDHYIGGGVDEEGVKYSPNNWIELDDGSPMIVGLRVKGIDDETKEQLKRFAVENIGKEYNRYFIKRQNKFYCTDLVTRAYESAGIYLNYDGFFVTGNDMIVCKETYIIFIREKVEIDGEDHYNIYYLVEE